MATLSEVVEQQEETNGKLEDIDERFEDFFRMMQRDKLELIEALREKREQKPKAEQKAEQKEEDKGMGMFGMLLGGLLPMLLKFLGLMGLAYGTWKLITEVGLPGLMTLIDKIKGGLNNIRTFIKDIGKSTGVLLEKLRSKLGLAPETPKPNTAVQERLAKQNQKMRGQEIKTSKGTTYRVGEFIGKGNKFQQVGIGVDGKPTFTPVAADKVPENIKASLNAGGRGDLGLPKNRIKNALKAVSDATPDFLKQNVGDVKGLRTATKIAKKVPVVGTLIETGLAVERGIEVAERSAKLGMSKAEAAQTGVESASAGFLGSLLDAPLFLAKGVALAGNTLGWVSNDTLDQYMKFSFSEAAANIVETERHLEHLTKDMVKPSQTGKIMSANSVQAQMSGQAPVIVNNAPQTNVNAPQTVVSNTNTTASPVNNSGIRLDSYK